MAERSLLQYQPVTGPVWREPVASRLQWLPQGQHQPARALPPNRLGDFARPEFAALYKPEGLQWQPRDRYAGQPLPRASLDWTVFPVQFAAQAYNPRTLEWLPSGRYPQVPVERRILGDFVQPPFASLYKPEGLQWLLQGQQPARSIPFVWQGSWVVDPKPVSVVTFDPQFFNFQATDIARTFALPRALQGDFTTPPLPPGPDVIPPPAPSVTQDVIRNFSLREWRKWHRPEDEKRLRELRVTPAVAEVIAEIAERQAQKLDLDEQQRLEELTRKLELKGLQWQGRYLELLNTQRQQLIDEEIGRLMRQKQAELQRRDEETILLLLTII